MHLGIGGTSCQPNFPTTLPLTCLHLSYRVQNMAGTNFDWTYFSWNENAFCTSPPQDYNHDIPAQQYGPNSQEYCLRATYPMFPCTPDRRSSSATESWSYITPLDPTSQYGVGSSNPNPSYTGTTDNMQYYVHSDDPMPSPTAHINTFIPKASEYSTPVQTTSPPSPVDPLWNRKFSINQEAYGSEDMLSSSCSSPAATKAIHSEYPSLRKRGRPRKSSSSSSCSSTTSEARSTRLPHAAIERKYREGMNAALDRLRRVVATLPQDNDSGNSKSTRLSKPMIIVGAIEYIESLEREKALQQETWKQLLSQRNNSFAS